MTELMPNIVMTEHLVHSNRTQERHARASQVAEKYAVIMAERAIRARVIPAGTDKAPAWSTSNTITFNADKLGDLTTPMQVASFKGLQVHELCHILFTPRNGSAIVRWVTQNNLYRYFNMLEDQRIETLWTALYPSTTPWLKATIYQHLLAEGSDWSLQYALVGGRKFVNARIRRTLYDKFKSQDLVAELKSIIDSYRTLTFTSPVDVETAKPLIKRYAEILVEAGVSPEPPQGGSGEGETPEGGCQIGNPTPCGSKGGEYDSTTTGRPLKKSEQDKAKAKAENTPVTDEDDVEPLEDDKDDSDLTDDDFDFGDPSDDDFEESEDGEDSGSGSDEDDEDDSDDDGGSNGGSGDDEDDDSEDDDSEDDDSEDDDSETEGETERGSEPQPKGKGTEGDKPVNGNGTEGDDGSDGDDESEDDGSETDSDEQGGNSAGAGKEDAPQSPPVSAQDLLKDALDNLLDIYGDQLADDIARISGELQLVGNRAEAPRDANWTTGSTTADARKGAYEFGRALEQLKVQYDPNWETEVEAGRLNIDRFMQEDVDLSEAFDRWDMGREDAVDIECVILLDKSGSMQTEIGMAYQSMWGIKSALDKVDASCTVVTFGSSTEVLYHANDKATNDLRNGGCGGGTEPLHALKYAQDVLANSARAVKLAIFITDGEWSRANECDEVVKTLREGGVLTALAYIPTSSYEADRIKEGKKVNAHQAEATSVITKADQLFGLGRTLVDVAIAKNLVK
jgi:Mg-chelatase subunit ChlD